MSVRDWLVVIDPAKQPERVLPQENHGDHADSHTDIPHMDLHADVYQDAPHMDAHNDYTGDQEVDDLSDVLDLTNVEGLKQP